jgi:glutaredoxin-related protein
MILLINKQNINEFIKLKFSTKEFAEVYKKVKIDILLILKEICYI